APPKNIITFLHNLIPLYLFFVFEKLISALIFYEVEFTFSNEDNEIFLIIRSTILALIESLW
ncbi:MAG: hypothetical protein ACOYIF_03185, partial [Acetivibrionales bacterium]